MNIQINSLTNANVYIDGVGFDILNREYRINKEETYPDPPIGNALNEVKRWCEEKRDFYKTAC